MRIKGAASHRATKIGKWIYREEAWYLDRTATWINRVGMDYVRHRVVDDVAGRQAAHQRFLLAQSFSQNDPWAERATDGVDSHEFQPLRKVG